jgi:polar amino acid transport system permease protein
VWPVARPATAPTMSTTFVYIAQGLLVALQVIAIALPTGFVLGVLLAILRVYGGPILSAIIAAYSAVMRGLPPIVLLFILYFGVTRLVNLSALWAGALALALISSAYQLEIFRGAFGAVSGGQMTAARAIGMRRAQAIRYIILPQALRIAIPPWSNEAATVIKDSSLVYALGVPEILRRAQFVSANTREPFIAFGVAALLYFAMTFSAGRLLDYVERRTAIPGEVSH